MRRGELVILAQLAAFLAHGAQGGVELVHLVIGVGEHEAGFVRRGGAVLRPLRDQRGAGLALRARPVDRALLLVDVERVVKIALGHHLGRAALVDLVLPLHLGQLGRAVAVFQRAEHAAALDAAELPVVADQNELRAGVVRVRGHHRHQLGVEHRGLVHDDDGAPVPARAAVVEREQLAVDRAARLKPSARMSCATALVGARPITR